MRLRKLARLCIHNGMGAHLFSDPSQCSCGGESDFCDHLVRCPGGEFLPEGALVIEKKGAANRLHSVLRLWNYDLNDYAIQKCADEVLDALASQVGESE